jgi:hypothetical protein
MLRGQPCTVPASAHAGIISSFWLLAKWLLLHACDYMGRAGMLCSSMCSTMSDLCFNLRCIAADERARGCVTS